MGSSITKVTRKNTFRFLVLVIVYLSSSMPVFGAIELESAQNLTNTTQLLVADQVVEHFNFYGLASYYNNITYYIVDEHDLSRIEPDEHFNVSTNQWLVAVGRLNVLIIGMGDLTGKLVEENLIFTSARSSSGTNIVNKIVQKSERG